jgi:hypothetical protein
MTPKENSMLRFLALALSLLAFPTLAASPLYVCWDGSVVKNVRKCPVLKLPLVCSDGTVVYSATDCPPVKVCLDGAVTKVGEDCPPPPVDPVAAE